MNHRHMLRPEVPHLYSLHELVSVYLGLLVSLFKVDQMGLTRVMCSVMHLSSYQNGSGTVFAC